MQVRMGQNKNPYMVLVGISTTIMETVWRFIKMVKIELPYDPVILLQDMYPKEHTSGYKRDT
jgi:hypothetical protein